MLAVQSDWRLSPAEFSKPLLRMYNPRGRTMMSRTLLCAMLIGVLAGTSQVMQAQAPESQDDLGINYDNSATLPRNRSLGRLRHR